MTVLAWGAAAVVAGGVAAATVIPMRRRRSSPASTGPRTTGPQPGTDLLQSDRAFRKAFENSVSGRAITDRDGRYLFVNRALCQLLGYSEEELLSMTFAQVTDGQDVAAQSYLRQRVIDGEIDGFRLEKRYVHKAGNAIWVRLTASSVSDQAGHFLYFITEVQDISDRKRFEDLLTFLTDNDPLTGLPNRRKFQEELSHSIKVAAQTGTQGAMLALSLDNFRELSHGLRKPSADEVMISVGQAIKGRLRDTDILARIDSDEFGIILPRADFAKARAVARELLMVVERSTSSLSPLTRFTASAGAAIYPDHGSTETDVVAAAYAALTRAKGDGGNGAVVFIPDTDQLAELAHYGSWQYRIRKALQGDGFTLYAQPIVNVKENRVSHYELLIRMVGEDGKIILPANFLGVAERSGLARDIDRWVVERAVSLLASLRQDGPPVHLEINLSALTLKDREFPNLVSSALTSAGADPTRLIFEVTETAAITNVQMAREFVKSLKGMGCRFALDDFGMGYSSFSVLKYLPVDYLKIDGSFIRNLAIDSMDQQLVRAMAEVARALGMMTIAEFVGDEESLGLVDSLGVNFAQGYLVGRPGPATEVFRPLMKGE